MGIYIHQHPDWPKFRFRLEILAEPLAAVRHRQGLLAGRTEALGFAATGGIVVEAISDEVQRSSEIEGERLDRDQVRSSVARRLGVEIGALTPAARRVEGLVDMVLDATQRFKEPLTAERLHGWHAGMFPTGRSGLQRIRVGEWRTDSGGPMQVVSGRPGREHIHFEAPGAYRIEAEMDLLLGWYASEGLLDPVLKAALAHLWFVTIHPYDDGNGRIGRAIADMALARSEQSGFRFYSMSAQIMRERDAYYRVLEETQKGDLDVTTWMVWFVACLNRALLEAETGIDRVLARARFWGQLPDGSVNERQRRVLAKVLDGFTGNLTARKWAAMGSCSHDTALRDIQDLIRKGIMSEGEARGRSTSYLLSTPPVSDRCG